MRRPRARSDRRRWLAASSCLPLLVTVIVGVVLAGFFGVMDCVQMMAVGHVSVVPGLLVIVGFVVLGSLEMVLRGVTVVLGSFAVMIRNFF
jgi:hypothetical protein